MSIISSISTNWNSSARNIRLSKRQSRVEKACQGTKVRKKEQHRSCKQSCKNRNQKKIHGRPRRGEGGCNESGQSHHGDQQHRRFDTQITWYLVVSFQLP